MNFNTTNNTFRRLMGNGLSYRVPSFQRDYSWSADEWDDLWQDVVGLFGADPEPAHYMGYLVLQSADNRKFDIIDGQQRMTTLSLLMLAAISHLTDLAAPEDPEDPQFRRARQLRGNYIGYLDPVSLVPRSKLTLNRHDDGFYQNYLVPLEQMPRRGLNPSEHLLRRAFAWFRDRIREYCGDDGEAVARFVDTAVDKLFFTVITVTEPKRSGHCVRFTRRTGNSGRRLRTRRCERPATATRRSCVSSCSGSRNTCPAAAWISRARGTASNTCCRRIRGPFGNSSMIGSGTLSHTGWATSRC